MPAITTPFTGKDEVDHDEMSANIRRLMKDGATGVVAAGCTGEFWSLRPEERREIYATARKAVGKDGTAIVGAAGITPRDVIAAMEDAAAEGADAALVMPPFFAHLSEAEVIAHFETVSEAAPLPVMLYNIPGNAGNALTPAIVDRLADLENVVAIKESSGDWLNFQGTLSIAGDRIRVFCGPSSTIGVPAMLAGCDGLVDCFPNVWPSLIDIWPMMQRGETEAAWEVQVRAQELTRLFISGGRTLYPATKAAMDYLGLPGGGAPRAPLQPLKGEPLAGLHRGLDRILRRAPNAA
ncbi:dihydrodipicolinate synthase family protein [Histidinibacterium aquaticum]|uniref:Dihydrodipicolinate synthase family protein n=1 Tax=Histidinibacterium aquaticum TaxID=2613962 RepID=A0A5J5GMC0_9RHOB|nr:dihydrodipicolinate synthase family protein [Histidinibacterium aquaticum]KAA9008803.1 dihydrodipicolinate synthase family protein [Histidinibacterium aquaticum]